MPPMTFEQIVQTIVADYFSVFEIDPVSIRYSIVDDMP